MNPTRTPPFLAPPTNHRYYRPQSRCPSSNSCISCCGGYYQATIVVLLTVVAFLEVRSIIHDPSSSFFQIGTMTGNGTTHTITTTFRSPSSTSKTTTTYNNKCDDHDEWTKSNRGGAIITTKENRAQLFPRVGICSLYSNNNEKHQSERYIDEWTDYHLDAMGFHEIFIVEEIRSGNNNNNTSLTLQEWAKNRGSTRVHVLPFQPSPSSVATTREKQRIMALNTCVQQFRDRVDVMAFFDHDEFLVLKKHRTIGDYLNNAPPKANNNTTIHLPRFVFGTARHTQFSPIPVTKRFQLRLKELDRRTKPMVWVANLDHHHLSDTHNTIVFPKSDGDKNNSAPSDSNRRANDDEGGVIAVLHYYKYKSAGEFFSKSSCHDDDDGSSDDGSNRKCGSSAASLKIGTVRDDTAWQILKTRLPDKYANFDQWIDYF